MDHLSSDKTGVDPFRIAPPFQKIVECADFGVGVIDRNGQYIFSNKKWAEMTGYTLDEIHSLNVADITVPDDLPISQSSARDLFAGSIPSYIIEKRFQRKDGTTFWGRVVATPLQGEDGKVEAINGLIADITTLRNALERIETDASLYRLIARVNTFLTHPDESGSLPERFAQEMVTDSPFLHCALMGDCPDLLHCAASPDAAPFPSSESLQPIFEESRTRHAPSLSTLVDRLGDPLFIAAIPVKRMDHFWGVLLLTSRSSELLSDATLPRLEVFAQTLSSALESRSLVGINLALHRISRLIGSRPLPQTLFDETCRILVDCGGFLDAAILLYDPETHSLVPEVIRGNIEKVGPLPMEMSFSVSPDHQDAQTGMVKAFHSGTPVINQDFSENFKKPEFERLSRWAKIYSWKSGASFPLFKNVTGLPDQSASPRGPVIGLLTVTSGEKGFFHDRLVALLEEASRNLSLALALHKEDEERHESREKLSKVTELYAALNGINRLVNLRPDEESLLNDTCRIINEIGMLYLVRILTVDRESGLIKPGAVHARDERMVPFFRELSFKTDPETIAKLRNLSPHACLLTNRPVIHHNLVKDLEAMGLEVLSAKAMEYGLCSQGSFPIIRNGQTCYILSVFAERIGFFDEALVSLLEEISKTVSHALENIDLDREKRTAEETLKSSEEKYRLLMEEAGDGILILDVETEIVIDANRQAAHLFGLKMENLVGLSKNSLLPDSARSDPHREPRVIPSELPLGDFSPSPSSRFRLTINSEFFREVEVIESRINWRTRQLLQIRLRDVTEMTYYENELKRLAQLDSLTGLLNRHAVWTEMDLVLSRQEPENHQLALYYIDLDNFKGINDTYGHETGDQLLISVARRIKDAVRDQDLVARIGGDEFLIVSPNALSTAHTEGIANRILSCLHPPFHINGTLLSIQASIGISLFPDHSTNIEELIRNADSAMYRAKRAGRNQFSIHDHPAP